MLKIKIPRTKDWDRVADDIEQFIKCTVDDAKANGVVIGISGGIDSAVVAELCKRAIGIQNVHLLLLPHLGQSTEDAEAVAHHIKDGVGGTVFSRISITMPVQYIATVRGALSKLSYGNLKARIRMAILYSYANEHNALVAGTTNRSEYLTGYFTKFGDGACDFEPILHLYKTEIFALAMHLCIPARIIKKKPSAELWAGQTDEGELGITYKKLDRILETMTTRREPAIYSFLSGATEKEVELVDALVRKSEHKRNHPPSPDGRKIYLGW